EATVTVPFAYTLPEAEPAGVWDALTGSLQPADVGLLARHPEQLSLGHWYPTWIPPGMRADAEPGGYGDRSNFAAADLSVELTVPAGWPVIDSGVRVDQPTTAGGTTVTSYGAGMRDLSVAVVKDFVAKSRQLGEVSISVWGPSDAERHLDAVLEETVAAV